MSEEPIKRVVEMHYAVHEIATLIRKSERYVRDKIKSGEFGADVFLISGDYIVAASGVNAFLESHRLQTPGVKARSEGELRRKLASGRFAAGPDVQ
jgi:hypothetical protein